MKSHARQEIEIMRREAELAALHEPDARPDTSGGNRTAPENLSIFLGHGRSPEWYKLKDFLERKLQQKVVQFNSEPAAGLSTSQRLESMMQSSSFAFIVMTAEEERIGVDGKKFARDNVIHEAGLFQGKLGFKRAILLVEEGCVEFSNIVGLVQIRFPKGDILARSEEIREVLKREGLFEG